MKIVELLFSPFNSYLKYMIIIEFFVLYLVEKKNVTYSNLMYFIKTTWYNILYQSDTTGYNTRLLVMTEHYVL